MKRTELTTKSGFFEDCDYYRLRFGTISGTELTAYLNKVTGVTVNGVAYTKESTYMKESTFRVKAENDAYGTSAYDILDLAVNGVDTTKDTVIVITAEGYDDVTYTIAKTGDGGGSTTDPSKPETPAGVAVDNCVFTKASASDEKTDYYRLTFKNLTDDELATYLRAIKSVEVDSVTYKEKDYLSFGQSQFRIKDTSEDYGIHYNALDLAANGVDTSKDVEVVIKATGYADLTYTIKKGRWQHRR